jgi:predicted porin
MKKSLLALAVLGAFAGIASAQTNVTVYGLVDLGIASERGAAGTKNSLQSGIPSGSRLGFRGTEDLGGGLKANFVLESGFNADTGTLTNANTLFSRQATVGLSGGFGAVNFGRRNTPFFNALDAVDPMATRLAGSATNLFATTGLRMNNSVIYTSPNLSGFTGEVAYGFGEVAGNSSANRQIGASLGYANGPLTVALAHHKADNATGTDSLKNTLLTGKYDFGVAAAHLAYARNKGLGVDSNDWLVGATVPFGASAVVVDYIRKNDKTAANQDAHQWALAYTYSLSKRTSLYTSYANVTNDNGAAYTTIGGYGDREFNVGLRHAF